MQYTLRSWRRLRGGSYQAPAAALVCNFPPDPAAPLSASAASTLFHEFGHVGAALDLRPLLPPWLSCDPTPLWHWWHLGCPYSLPEVATVLLPRC